MLTHCFAGRVTMTGLPPGTGWRVKVYSYSGDGVGREEARLVVSTEDRAGAALATGPQPVLHNCTVSVTCIAVQTGEGVSSVRLLPVLSALLLLALTLVSLTLATTALLRRRLVRGGRGRQAGLELLAATKPGPSHGQPTAPDLIPRQQATGEYSFI